MFGVLHRWVGALVVCTLLGVPADAGPPSVSLTVVPRIAFAGADARVTIRILRHPDNRRFRFVCYHDGLLMVDADRPHEGEGAPSQIVLEKELRSLQVGFYTLRAGVLRRSGEELWSEETTIDIRGEDQK